MGQRKARGNLKMKTKSAELKLIWEDLEAIFLDYNGVNARVIKDLAKLGFEVYGNKHPKIRVKGKIITMDKTPSDVNAGRQILRQIRRIYESEELL